MKDAMQKDLLCKHFNAQGWYVQPEIPVFHKGGIHEKKKLITDIDVLALRPGTNLHWELILGDCKTLKGQSPANRALWLRGLMEVFSASSGIIILQRERKIEEDHKLFAASLKITLLDEGEFKKYDHAIIYPEGSSNNILSLNDILGLLNISKNYIKLKTFCNFIYGFLWNEANRIELLRRVIGEAQSVSKEIDPNKPEHLALVLDATGIFSIGLAECVGNIFSQYLQPDKFNDLNDALKIIIWGGHERYNFINKLRHDLIIAKGLKPSSTNTLALPIWDDFLQLVRNMLENPRLVFLLPQLFRQAAIDVLKKRDFLKYTNPSNLLLIKYAMLTSNYFCQAATLPPQTRQSLEAMFVKRQSELVEKNNKVKSTT